MPHAHAAAHAVGACRAPTCGPRRCAPSAHRLGMHGRCQAHAVWGFSLRTRLFRTPGRAYSHARLQGLDPRRQKPDMKLRCGAKLPVVHTPRTAAQPRARARALIRLRCCSTPLAACPSNHKHKPRAPARCDAHADETAEHVLVGCPAYEAPRSKARFAPPFRLNTLIRTRATRAPLSHSHGSTPWQPVVPRCFEASARHPTGA